VFAADDSGLDRARFRRLARRGTLVPLVRELVADTLTPVAGYLKLRQAGTPAALLESAEGGERWGRWSVLGTRPRATLRFDGAACTRTEAGVSEVLDRPPFEAIRAELARHEVVRDPAVPRFAGGLVGYLGYDTVRWSERIPDRHRPPTPGPFPDALLLRFEDAVVFDNARQRALVVAWADLTRARPEAAYADAVARIEATTRALAGPLPPAGAPPVDSLVLEPAGGRAKYLRNVRKALEYIRAGDVFQVVLSESFEAKARLAPEAVYRALRAVNPSPYLFLLELADGAIAGSSPELLVRVEDATDGRGREVVVRPIAGTRRRGATPAEDRALEAELKDDPKERAEHVMLVDLGRNDIGRVSALGSVKVEELMITERYSHVMHLVSQVRGRLAEGRDALDALAAAFPAGTVSGAPKIRAMEIIDELEPARRGPYAGAIGAISFDGQLDFALTIRTARVLPDRTILQAGAGIVADSDPGAEWAEVEAKCAGVLRALKLAGGVS
jgi:anthranilate synthase component 1